MNIDKVATPRTRHRLPDAPERNDDEKAANFDFLHARNAAERLSRRLGSPLTTLVAAERRIVARPVGSPIVRVPDLMVAFDVDPELYRDSDAYIISEQGKPPDFILEVASKSTGEIDITDKRADYEALGVVEYWRFDTRAEYHKAYLEGDRLVGGAYQPIQITETPAGVLEGYSPALDLKLCWEEGELEWRDPITNERLATMADFERIAERANERADWERERADSLSVRLREMEEENRRLRGE